MCTCNRRASGHRRFAEPRRAGRYGEPRTGVTYTVSDEDFQRVVSRTFKTTPAYTAHWSTRSMAKATWDESLEQRADRAGVRARAPPDRVFSQLSPDRLFIGRVLDIVDLYVPSSSLVRRRSGSVMIEAQGKSRLISRGKRVASLTFGARTTRATNRSSPIANPPCGGMP